MMRKFKTMENNFDKLAAVQKANIEVLMSLIRTAFNGIERLTALNMAASRDIFSQNINNTQQVFSAKNTDELSQINASLAQPNISKWMDYSRNLYDLIAELQKEITNVIRNQYDKFSEKISEKSEQVKAACPVGGDIFASSVKSMLDFSNQTFAAMSSMATQMREIAENSLKNNGKK